MTGDVAQAEDLAQDTFVKAFRNLAAFDPTRRLSSWLFRIAHNTALDSLRRVRPAFVPIDIMPGQTGERAGIADLSTPPAPDPVERRALGQALESAIAQLRPEQRVAVSLRYEEGLSFDEIGQVLGVPEATARSHVYRARKELSRRLADAGWEP